MTVFENIENVLDPAGLWAFCEDNTIDWKKLAEKNLRDYQAEITYDGILYCMNLLLHKLKRERDFIDDGEKEQNDLRIFRFGRLMRLYRASIQ